MILEDDVSRGENEKYHVLEPELWPTGKTSHCLWLLSLWAKNGFSIGTLVKWNVILPPKKFMLLLSRTVLQNIVLKRYILICFFIHKHLYKFLPIPVI